MVINLSFERPFHGVVFSDNHFGDEECRWRGNGGHYLLVVVPLEYSSNETTTRKPAKTEKERRGFCGLAFDRVSF